MKTKQKKLTAKYWQYQGNHDNGKDTIISDPHGFGLHIIDFLKYIHQTYYYYGSLSKSDLKSVEIVYHRDRNDFGQSISVKAEREVWEKAKKEWEDFE